MARKYKKSFKAQVALEALRNDSSIAKLAKKHDVHPAQITKWKTELMKGATELFQRKNGAKEKDHTAYLEQKIRTTYY